MGILHLYEEGKEARISFQVEKKFSRRSEVCYDRCTIRGNKRSKDFRPVDWKPKGRSFRAGVEGECERENKKIVLQLK